MAEIKFLAVGLFYFTALFLIKQEKIVKKHEKHKIIF